MAKKKKPHQKPTKEELEEGVDKSLKELEEIEEKNDPKDFMPEDEPEEDTEGGEEKEPEPEEKKELDYKKKFIESTKEAQILFARNKKVNEAFEKAKELPEPTEEELRKEFEDWDLMSDTEKRMAKDNLMNTRKFEAISNVTTEFREIEKWQDKVGDFLDDPKTLTKHPELDGREDEFLRFAIKPTRRGADFEILVSAFLYKASSKPKKKKKAMFETGSGGPSGKPKPKSDKISIEEARRIRAVNYSRYRKLTKAGKIDTQAI